MLNGIGASIGSDTVPETIGDIYVRTGCQPAVSTQAEVDAILAKGHRKIEPPDLLRLHSDHARSLRSAYLEGHADGSQGYATKADAERAWGWSDARRHLLNAPIGRSAIGSQVLCSDERAASHPVWKIRAVGRELAWISAGNDDLLVAVSALRGILGGEAIA